MTPTDAHGTGSELLDERVLFYLRHREQIDTWASIRRDAEVAAHDVLKTFKEKLGDVAASRKLELRYIRPSAGYRGFTALDGTTPPAEGSRGWPNLACCFVWRYDGLRLDLDAAGNPFVGVRAEEPTSISSAFRAVATSTTGWRSEKGWPAWRRIVASREWWADIDAYRDAVAASFDELLTTYQPVIAGVLRAHPSPTPFIGDIDEVAGE